MKTVALVTFKKMSSLSPNDKLLIPPFQKQGFTVYAVPWEEKNISWKNFDLVILRSCWNYYLEFAKFSSWLRSLHEKKVNLWNPLPAVLWNLKKTYLWEMQKRGITIVPSFLYKKEEYNPEDILSKNQSEIFIVKPTIGASGYNLWKIKRADLKKKGKLIENLFKKTPEIIIQPFLEEITKEGEYSFIFLGGKYSHTVLKKPKRGEFRTNERFGAHVIKIFPSPFLLNQAQKIYHAIPFSLLYARIDAICLKNILYLMELELIEPYLYLDKKSAEKLVEASISKNVKVSRDNDISSTFFPNRKDKDHCGQVF